MGESGVRGRTGVVVAVAVSALLLGQGRLAAEELDVPDPCAGTVRLGDANRCWGREAERADAEMRRVYVAVLEKLPRESAENLKKAQKLWMEFRDAHVSTLLGGANAGTYGPEYPTCLSILRWRLARDRAAELKRLLEPDDESLCPL